MRTRYDFSNRLIGKFQQGFSLVELMVGMLIGLFVSLAIAGVLSTYEGRKRTTTSVNDIDQAGAYALYQMDKVIRSAGSGMSAGMGDTKASLYTYGCPIRASRSGTQLLPASSFPVPFNTVSANVRLVPAVILDEAAGAGGDVLMVMAGSGGLGESPNKFSATPTSTSLNFTTVAGFGAGDVALLTALPTGTLSPCLMTQVSPLFVPTAAISAVPLAGEYYQATVAGTAIASYPITAIALNLGKNPAFSMFGVGANNTLLRYDLLSPSDTSATSNRPNPSPFVDSVYQMQAIYGIDNDGNPNVHSLTWVAPTGAYSSANLLAGTAAANAALNTIKAIKVGIVMRTSLPEKENVSDESLTLFESTSVPVTVNVAPLNYRYRALEATIPIRNSLM